MKLTQEYCDNNYKLLNTGSTPMDRGVDGTCPQCGSTDIEYQSAESWYNAFTCNKCNTLTFHGCADRMCGNYSEDYSTYDTSGDTK